MPSLSYQEEQAIHFFLRISCFIELQGVRIAVENLILNYEILTRVYARGSVWMFYVFIPYHCPVLWLSRCSIFLHFPTSPWSTISFYRANPILSFLGGSQELREPHTVIAMPGRITETICHHCCALVVFSRILQT